MDLLAEATEVFETLPVQHHRDEEDFRRHVRAAMNLILARVGDRSQAKISRPTRSPIGFA